ncbi:MAG: hypothetical protein H0X46_03305 [Bacteroidetes bacterium]|nr:hypothetical protein [Bacteroidota bacterium]
MDTNVFVFKTNINTLEQIERTEIILSGRSDIKKWNIDLEDCDKVLRIETSKKEIESVLGILMPYQIYCEELE